MIKKIILLALLNCSVFADIKVDLIETKEIKIPELSTNYSNIKTFNILCINGYQWLHSGYGSSATLSQMFESNYVSMGNAKPITCKNKD